MIPDLPKTDRVVLQVALRLVPAPERAEWVRYWRAELWHYHHPRSQNTRSASLLYSGLLGDALWLQADKQRRAFVGTALVCLLCLSSCALVSAVPLFALLGSPRRLPDYLTLNAWRFACEASLVTLVSLARTGRLVEHTSPSAPFARIRANTFYACKVLLVLLIAFFLSCDFMQALHASHAFTAELLQPELFVILALFGLRWNFRDSGGRCKHCLRTLAIPTRVGRPSWNFLDTNGTELLCEEGHGVLSIPEMETSWRQSSRWIAG